MHILGVLFLKSFSKHSVVASCFANNQTGNQRASDLPRKKDYERSKVCLVTFFLHGLSADVCELDSLCTDMWRVSCHSPQTQETLRHNFRKFVLASEESQESYHDIVSCIFSALGLRRSVRAEHTKVWGVYVWLEVWSYTI